MKKNKIITFLIIISFFILLSFFYWGEYLNFHQSSSELKNHNEEIIQEANTFNINDVKEINKIDFFYTPSKELIDKIIEKIDLAESYIYIEIYMFTEKRIKEALNKANKRWVDIKIIIEKNPYMIGNINNKFFEEFKKMWIDIVWSNQSNYSLNHSKMILIDWLSIISTWNLTYSTFTKNRDFFIFIDDSEINKKLLEIFNYDFLWIKKDIYHENLVLSPNYSRKKINKLLDYAKNDIKIYMQYFKDEQIRKKLLEIKKEKNIEITAIIPSTAEKDEETIQLINAWINIKILKWKKMHSKAILIDNEILFIWSLNFSNYSFDQNREIWILIKNNKIIKKFLTLFLDDLNN